MHIHPKLQAFAAHILTFLQLQLFLTLISWPILISWGLPISLLSPIGNFIFTPALTAFLFIASLIFFTSLLNIPNSALFWSLERITEWWHWCMKCAHKSWLYGTIKPSWIVLCIIPATALLILHSKYIRSVAARILCFLLLLLATCGYLYLSHEKNNSIIHALPCNRGSVTMVHHARQLVVIDPGVIGQSIAASSWIEYTLAPTITTVSGKTTIDHLILLQPGHMLFEAVETLTKKMRIKHVYLVYWQGILSKREWACFFGCKRALQENNCVLHRIGEKPITIALDAESAIRIEALKENIAQKEITYCALCATVRVGEKEEKVVSYKAKEKKIV